MKTSVWRLIEAVIQAGPAQRNTCDLVMLLNTKFSSEEDFKKFSGFVIGLLKYDPDDKDIYFYSSITNSFQHVISSHLVLKIKMVTWCPTQILWETCFHLCPSQGQFIYFLWPWQCFWHLMVISGDQAPVWWANILPAEAVLHPFPPGHALQLQHTWGDHHSGGEND